MAKSPSSLPSPSRRKFFTIGAASAAVSALPFSARIAGATSAKSEGRHLNHQTFATGAVQVRGIATGPSDEIYVAADREVLVFSAQGIEAGRISVDGEPACVAVGPQGRLYVGLDDHVEIFARSGERLAKWAGLGAGVRITDIGVSAAGAVFVSDGGNREIWHLNKDGAVVGRNDRHGKKFSTPQDFFPIAVTPNGRLAAGNPGRHRIEEYDFAGELKASWGERSRSGEGFGGCCNPISFALAPDGSYITAEGGLPRVKRFDADGNFLEIIADAEDLEANARGSHERASQPASCHAGGLEVAVDSQGRVLLLDRVTAEVRILTA